MEFAELGLLLLMLLLLLLLEGFGFWNADDDDEDKLPPEVMFPEVDGVDGDKGRLVTVLEPPGVPLDDEDDVEDEFAWDAAICLRASERTSS